MRKLVQMACLIGILLPTITACTTFPMNPIVTPTPRPTPTPLSEYELMSRQMALEFVDMNWYVTVIDSLWFVGTIKNTGDVDVESIRIDITLLDQSGNKIASDYGYVDYGPLSPGETAPFTVLFSDVKDPQWATYHAEADANPYYLDFYYKEFSTSVETAGIENGYYLVRGEVTNIGDVPAQYVQIVGAFYDSSGRIVATTYTFIDADVLESNQSAPFILNVSSQVDEIDSFDLYVTSLRYDPDEE